MPRIIHQWRFGTAPDWNYVWAEESPDQDAVIVDTISTELPVSDSGMPTVSVTPSHVNRSFFEFGNGDASVDCAANTTTFTDIRISEDKVGADGKAEIIAGEYWNDSNAQPGDYVEMSVLDKDNVLGYFGAYGLGRNKLAGLTSVSGTFTVGETVTGGTSGATGKILAVGSDYLEIQADFSGTFTATETLTGGTSGATAVLGSVVAGDVLELKKYIKKRHIEPNEHHSKIAPGGASTIYLGLYIRIAVVTVSAGMTRKFFWAIDAAK